jgi:protein-S-isoprenylcysteine O-methyltransferase Ste14
LVLVPAAIVTLFTPPFVAGDSLEHLALQTVAWIAFAAGATFRFWATLYIGGRKERDLVTEGPYSLCRHPLYLGSLLLGISAAFFLESPLFLGAVLAVGGIYINGTIPVEETVLRSRHTPHYDAYCERVPRLVPRSFVVDSPGEISVDVHRLWLECARASRWVWLPIVGLMMNHFRALAWWPKFFFFRAL